MGHKILVINTGNTSTKVGVFDSYSPVFEESIPHTDGELAPFKDVNAQKDFREDTLMEFLKNKGVELDTLDAVAARGGLLRPVPSGTFKVNDKMIADLVEGKRGLHASHLSAQIGYDIAGKLGIPCYIVDPISVDEFEPVARYTGHKQFERIMLCHALNMKAVAKRYAKENSIDYSRLNLIVVHLGTGISVSVHSGGKMVDSINSSEEGCFSPDRAGGIPVLQAAKYALENKMDFNTFRKMIFGSGGLASYLGTKDFRKVAEMYHAGEKEAIEVVHAMVYQVAKEVGALATVTNGKIDKILVTGGMAYQEFLVNLIKERIEFIAPIILYPGEDELEALAEGVCRVLDKEEEARIY